MDSIFDQYERGRLKTRERNSNAMCLSMSSARVETLIPKAPVEQQLSFKLMFYEPPPDDNYTNRAVAQLTREKMYDSKGNVKHTFFAHVEIGLGFDLCGNTFATQDSPGQMMAFSINQYSNLYFRLKTFRSQYRAISMNVPESKYKKLFSLCSSLAAENIAFDYWGMYSAPVAPDVMLKYRYRNTHGTYCSKIITEVLQQCEIGNDFFRQMKPWRATPNLLSTSFPEACLG